MKNKSFIIPIILGIFCVCACSSVKSEEDNMKKAALQITNDFVKGNVNAFIQALEPSVRSNYPADQITSANQALSVVLGAVVQIDSVATLNLKDLTPVASVVVNYQNGSVEYQSSFDDKGKIISFIPVPVETEEIFTESEIVEQIDSIPMKNTSK